MKNFCYFFIILFLLFCRPNISEAGLSKINSVRVEVKTNIIDEAKIKSINKNELLNELYLSIKSRVPYISINDNAEYTLLIECYAGPYVLGINDKNYEAYSLILTLQSINYFYDDISSYYKIYWQARMQSMPSSVTDNKFAIKEQIKSLIDSFAEDWYKDQDNEKR